MLTPGPCFFAGEEERHPASELNRHEPTVRGWQSARQCKYPQELVLRLQRPSAIRRVQVLAHQCLIRKYSSVSRQQQTFCVTDPNIRACENVEGVPIFRFS